MANTYEIIASSTVGSGGTTNIEFTLIPGTYTDLVLFLSLRSDRSAQRSAIALEFNNSSSSYQYRRLFASGSTPGSDTDSTLGYVYAGEMNAASSTATTFSNNFIYIPNYAGSTYKSVSSDTAEETNDATNNRVSLIANLWSNTSAITSIKLFDGDSGTAKILQHSTAYLYGIKKN
jgi:hypothetical protein